MAIAQGVDKVAVSTGDLFENFGASTSSIGSYRSGNSSNFEKSSTFGFFKIAMLGIGGYFIFKLLRRK